MQEDKKEPVKDTSIVYISNCFVGSDMTAHAFDSLVEKVNEKSRMLFYLEEIYSVDIQMR